MALNFSRIGGFPFSLLKKKIFPIKQKKYSTYSELYHELSRFEAGLDELEIKKIPKKLQDFTKRFRRMKHIDRSNLFAIPMEINSTYQYFVRKSDEIVFGVEEQQRQTNLEELIQITGNMVKFGLDVFKNDLIPIVSEKQTLFKTIDQRFINVEERLSRVLFKKYTSFSTMTSQLSFLSERQYKGDFKFQLIQDVKTIQKASQCLYHCAKLNFMKSKLILACEKAVSQYHHQLNDKALSRLIYCLVVAGKPLKYFGQNYLSFAQKLYKYPLTLLFYMTICEVQEFVILKSMIQNTKFQATTIDEEIALSLIKQIIRSKYSLEMKTNLKQNPFEGRQKHGGQIFFQHFLERYQYSFEVIQSKDLFHTIYKIQDKQFICLDHRLISTQNFNLNGLGILYTQYFNEIKTPFKHINWPRMLTMDKRTVKDEYILSKFKGITKPKIIKVRFYD